MNGMELNVNYSILFLYTCGLAYYSVSWVFLLWFFFCFLRILDWWGECKEGWKMQLGLGVCSFLFPAHAQTHTYTHTHKVTKWLMSLQVGVDIGYLIATVQIEY